MEHILTENFLFPISLNSFYFTYRLCTCIFTLINKYCLCLYQLHYFLIFIYLILYLLTIKVESIFKHEVVPQDVKYAHKNFFMYWVVH